MSYQIQLSSAVTPALDLEVFPFMNKLRQEAGEQPPSALLQRFHDALAGLFPDSPWSDVQYGGDAGRLTVVRRRKVVVPHVLYLAGELGLTVVDNQSGEIHRPPTYQVVLEGPAEGVDLGEAATRLAALMRKPVTEMLALLSGGRRTVVKKGVPRFQADQYVAALRERAGCQATLAAEPGPVARPKPPAPAPMLEAVTAPAHVMPPMSHAPAEAKADPRSNAPAEAEPPAHGTDAELYDVAEGVRLVCCAIGLNLLLRGVIATMAPVPAAFSSLLLSLMIVYGALRITAGLRYRGIVRIALTLVVLSPVAMGFAVPYFKLRMSALVTSAVASLLTMVALGIAGTRRLKKAGYKVGLFGASKDDVRHLGAMGSGERLQSTTLAWATFILVFLTGVTDGMSDKPKPKELTDANVPCDFVGTWEVEKDGGRHELRVADNGTYLGILLAGRGQGRAAEYAGKWRYTGASLVWTDEAYTPVRLTVNNVTDIGRNEFTALDGSGQKVVFQLKQRGPSQRCKY